MKMKNMLVGVTLIVVSIILILSSANVIPPLNILAGEISWITAVICILLILYVVKMLLSGSIAGIFVSLAFIFMLLEKNIAISLGMEGNNMMNNWVLLLCAILLEIGFSILLKPKKAQYQNRFSSAVVYVDLLDSKAKRFSNKFGDLTIRFENVEQLTGESRIYLDSKYGNVEIEVPSNIYYICMLENKFGYVSMQKNNADESAPKLIIEGKSRFGAAAIKIV